MTSGQEMGRDHSPKPGTCTRNLKNVTTNYSSSLLVMQSQQCTIYQHARSNTMLWYIVITLHVNSINWLFLDFSNTHMCLASVATLHTKYFYRVHNSSDQGPHFSTFSFCHVSKDHRCLTILFERFGCFKMTTESLNSELLSLYLWHTWIAL